MLCAGLHVHFKGNLNNEEEQAVKEDSAETMRIHDQSSTPSSSDVCFSVLLWL